MKTTKITKKAAAIGETFMDGFLTQLTAPVTTEISVCTGLYQGLKYNGSLIRGIKTGAVVAVVICSVSGVINVINNRDYIAKI